MKQTVNVLRPVYYNMFECIGSKCKDNCCHTQWGIFVEEDIYKKYKKVVNAELNTKLAKSVTRVRSGAGKQKFGKIKQVNGCCTLMDEEGLCSVYKHLGLEYMSTTCRVYPRHINKVGDDFAKVMSLSCEEVARIALKNKEPMEFEIVTEEIGEETIYSYRTDSVEGNWTMYHPEYRAAFITILQDRKYTINERLAILGLMCEQLDEAIKNERLDSIPNIIGEFLSCLETNAFVGILDDVETRLDIQHEIYKEFVKYNIAIKKLTTGLIDSFIAATYALALDQEFNDDVADRLKLCNEKYNKFMLKHEYILENYLVNHIIFKAVPTAKGSLMGGFFSVIIRYTYLKMLMAGIPEESLSEDRVIEVIRLIEKHLSHSPAFVRIITILQTRDQLELQRVLSIINN